MIKGMYRDEGIFKYQKPFRRIPQQDLLSPVTRLKVLTANLYYAATRLSKEYTYAFTIYLMIQNSTKGICVLLVKFLCFM